jgi:uncharacterized protein (TIGR03437 family)
MTTSGTIQSVAPTLFSMSGDGRGVAAANAIQVSTANPQVQSAVPVFQCADSVCNTTPIALRSNTTVYLILYGTGIRGRGSLANVTANINGIDLPVLYAGPQLTYEGLDQVNLALPLSLSGSGQVNVVLTVNGQTANVVTVDIL